MSGDPLLSVRGLETHYPVTEGLLRREVGRVRAVDGVDFDVRDGETLGLVGESGCGKSTAARTVLRLEEPTAGEVRFDGEDVLAYDRAELRAFRRRAQMIFQDPNSSFDPRMSVGDAVAEPLLAQGMADRDRRRAVVVDLLERVGLTGEEYDRYPHEFSGGQKQRIALARALVLNPDLLVADEPVSALDVSVQAEILSLLDDLRRAFGLSVLLITHDMSVVRQVCDRVAVMYLGELVEVAPTDVLFADPQHPYTRSLVEAVPAPDPAAPGGEVALGGDVPDPADPPPGCRFHPRCPAVVQPDRYDLPQSEWRAVMDLRVAVRDERVDLDAIRDRLGREGVADRVDGVPAAALRTAVREEYDVPETLSDPAADERLARALDVLLDGERATAVARLGEAFPTVCVDRAPDLAPTSAGHPAACFLHGADAASGNDPDDADGAR